MPEALAWQQEHCSAASIPSPRPWKPGDTRLVPVPEFPYPESQPNQARIKGTPFYPMELLNGLVVSKTDRQAPSSDFDMTPRQFRRYIGNGTQDVQLNCGTQRRLRSGLRFGYRGAGYLFTVEPRIPGQTRGNYGGFHKRGPDPLSMQNLFANGPGAQPANPGGPGKIAAPAYQNPMTG